MVTETPDRHLLIRLVTDVFRLREVIFRSEEDSKLRNDEDPVKFNYIIDTPVFRYFGEPSRLAHFVSALPILQTLDAEEERPQQNDGATRAQRAKEIEAAKGIYEPGLAFSVRQANALLTIEYIVGTLVGGNLLISPQHVREITAYIAKAEVEAARGSIPEEARRSPIPGQQRPGGYLDMRQLLRGIQQTVKAERLSPADALEILNTSILNVLRRATDIAAVSRIDALIKRGVLANASSHPSYTRDILAPHPKYVDDWVRRIKYAKRYNGTQPTEVALEADGATLAQLSLLNADWEEDREVFVLITDDHGLHTAYKQWMREHPQETRDKLFYPLRYCKQYAPILNIREMGGAYDSADIFADIRRAVFQFADTFSTGDTIVERSGRLDVADASHVPSSGEIGRWLRHQFQVSANAADGPSSTLDDRERDLETQIKAISFRWIEAMRRVVVAKADVLAEFAERELEFWRDQLHKLEFDQAFRTNIGDLTTAFDKSTSASTMLLQEFYAAEARPAAAENKDHGRRIVASTFADFQSDGFKHQTIEAVTAKIVKHKKPIEFLDKADPGERLLVLGALCLEIGAWRGAVTNLTHASQRVRLLEPDQQRAAVLSEEIEFFRCVARRVAASHLTWFKEYQELDVLLDAMAEQSLGDIAQARVVSEHFALSVSTFAWINDRTQEEEACRIAFTRLQALWEGRVGERLRAGGGDAVWQRLRSQICLNVLVLAFWWIQVHGHLIGPLAEIVDFASAETRDPERDQSHNALHLPIYPALLEFALTESAEERTQLAHSLIARFDEILMRDIQGGYAFQVANVDKAEFRKIRTILVRAGGRPERPDLSRPFSD